MRCGIFPSSMLSLGDQGSFPSALPFVFVLYSYYPISLLSSFGLPAQVPYRHTPSPRVSKTTDSNSDPQGTELESGFEPGRVACQGDRLCAGPVVTLVPLAALWLCLVSGLGPCAALSPLCRT